MISGLMCSFPTWSSLRFVKGTKHSLVRLKDGGKSKDSRFVRLNTLLPVTRDPTT